uniref:Uncharacterized protein n=1 Tax=viral metagenome TaxID=1070528 RepID=A0A6M3X8R7_9ZZZZ
MTEIIFNIGFDAVRNMVLTYINDNSGLDPITHEELARSLYLTVMKDNYVAMKIKEAKEQAEIDVSGVV